jgi:hypothetical protein
VRRIPIQLKVAAALSVPLLALAVVTTIGVAGASDERAEVQRQTDLARAAIGPAGVLTTLQNERIWITVDLLALDGQLDLPVSSNEEAYGQTAEALADLQDRVASGDGAVAEVFALALARLSELDQVRADIDEFKTSGETDTATIVSFAFGQFDKYTEMMAPLYDATTNVAADIKDEELRQGTEVSDSMARGIESMTVLAARTVTIGLISAGGVDERPEIIELSSLRASLQRQIEFLQQMPAPWSDIPIGQDAIGVFIGIDGEADQAISTGRFSFEHLIDGVNLAPGVGVFGFQDELHQLINARADQLESDAADRQVRLLALALISLALVLLLNVVVSRSITSPLHSLTRQAKDLAEARLPGVVKDVLDQPLRQEVQPPEVEPVHVESSREVGTVVGALNMVQGTVVELAMSQALYRRNMADLFVSLGGRNQQLLRRQHTLITNLDTPMSRPGARAGVLQLDHLAAQMRRNSESLLAVAGIEVRRRRGSDVAMRVADVVRSALETVDDPSRTVVRSLEPAAFTGTASTDLADLVAELVESALAASPAGYQVEIRGGHRAETGGYWLAVVDFGNGLPSDEVAAANRRIGGDDSVPTTSATPANPVGHVVAGHLARRAGVGVHLDSSPGWGIMATIEVPRDHLTAIPPQARPGERQPAASAGGSRPNVAW